MVFAYSNYIQKLIKHTKTCIFEREMYMLETLCLTYSHTQNKPLTYYQKTRKIK